MNVYKPIEIKKFATKNFKPPTEAKRFKKYSELQNMNLNLTCNDIKICETNPYLIAYFVHDLIYYFDLISETTKSKFPYIDDRINCGNLRKDGKLIFSGLNNGKILVHEANKKLCIRNYNFHKLQINSLEVSSNLTDLLSSSNDLSIKIFNLSRNEPILSFDKAHTDYVKTAKYIDENTIISGGSDKYIKLWDIREYNHKPINVINNEFLVNDITVLNETTFLTTAENFINKWDIKTLKLIQQVNPIQNNIERIRVNSEKTRLFAFSPNEKFIKVLELENLKTLFSIKQPKELSSFDISQSMDVLALAYTDGQVIIKGKKGEEKEDEEKKDDSDNDIEMLDPSKYAERDVVKNYKYFFRGQNEKSDSNDTEASFFTKKKLKDYDVFFKKFQYHSALDAALKTKNVEIIISVLEELLDRNALKVALLNRNENELELILNFILWKLRDGKCMNLILNMLDDLIDFYSIMVGSSQKIDGLFRKILELINNEIDLQRSLITVNTKIESISNLNLING